MPIIIVVKPHRIIQFKNFIKNFLHLDIVIDLYIKQDLLYSLIFISFIYFLIIFDLF